MPDLPPVFSGPKTSKRRKNAQAAQRNKNRALPTNHRRWRRIRELQLAREPLCAACKKEGGVTAATDVDHVDGDAHNNDPDNLQSLCRSCHSKKTAREMARGSDGRW